MSGRVNKPYRICFGGPPLWRQVIDERIDRRDFMPDYGFSPAIDPDAFEAVVPLAIADYAEIRHISEIASRAIMPSSEVVTLCADKRALDDALSGLGFAEFSPGRTGPGENRFPYVAKVIRGDAGVGVTIIASPDDERRHAGFLERSDVFCQTYLPGRIEYGAHFLIAGGKVRYQRTMRHEMAYSPIVKGDDAFPRRSRPVSGPDPFAGRLGALLAAIGYEGTACIDYKVTAEGLKIMEINPRMGVSLLRFINEWLDAYLVALGVARPRSAFMGWCAARRRSNARRLRRIVRSMSRRAVARAAQPAGNKCP